MIYYKNPVTLEVFAYETVEERELHGAPELEQMTDEDVYAHLHPQPAPLTREQVQEKRLAAYRAESDQLKLQADFDALQAGAQPDYSAWIAAVEAIKQRYPLPPA